MLRRRNELTLKKNKKEKKRKERKEKREGKREAKKLYIWGIKI